MLIGHVSRPKQLKSNLGVIFLPSQELVAIEEKSSKFT